MADPDKLNERTVLVVDDDPDILKFVSAALAKRNIAHVLAENGREALEALDDSVDLILLDIMMPEIDGLEVLKKLAQKPAAQRPGVIAMSGGGPHLSGWHAGGLAEALGANEVLFKPFSLQELFDLVDRYLVRK